MLEVSGCGAGCASSRRAAVCTAAEKTSLIAQQLLGSCEAAIEQLEQVHSWLGSWMRSNCHAAKMNILERSIAGQAARHRGELRSELRKSVAARSARQRFLRGYTGCRRPICACTTYARGCTGPGKDVGGSGGGAAMGRVQRRLRLLDSSLKLDPRLDVAGSSKPRRSEPHAPERRAPHVTGAPRAGGCEGIGSPPPSPRNGDKE